MEANYQNKQLEEINDRIGDLEPLLRELIKKIEKKDIVIIRQPSISCCPLYKCKCTLQYSRDSESSFSDCSTLLEK